MKELFKLLKKQWLTTPFFLYYLAIVLRLTVFRDSFLPLRLMGGRFDEPWNYYHYWIDQRNWTMLWRDFSWNYIGNVAGFIPLGMYIAFYQRKHSILVATLAGLLLSLFIESSQYLFTVGISSISDLITNTAGAWLGAVLIQGLKRKAESYSN